MPSTSGALALRVENVDDLQRLARLFAASGLFGQPRGNPDAFLAECAIKVLAGMEAGFTPFASATGVTVINGKPGFSANLLAQAIKRHPVYDYRVMEKSATTCRIRFLANGEELGVEAFTMEMAERAGLLKTSGPWKQYPEAMLFARCLTAGMRTHCPDALGGHAAYTAEELGSTELVTVAEVPSSPAAAPVMLSSTDDLVGGAQRACEARGLTPAGITALCQEIGSVSCLSDLPRNMLARLAKSGVTADTVERCNAQAEALTTEVLDDPDDLPAAWN